MTPLQDWLERQRSRTNNYLQENISEPVIWPSHLHRAMCYSLFPGGDRLQATLALGAFDVVAPPGVDLDRALPVAAALELIHVYTQLHDGLPCMADDDYRWGRPTCHRVFPQGLAILAGSALLTLAFQWVSDPSRMKGVEVALIPRIIQDLSCAAGFEGVLGGQSMGLGFEGPVTEIEHLTFLQGRKTGTLFRTACMVGGRLGGADQASLRTLEDFGEQFGRAFQIASELQTSPAREQPSGDTWTPTWPALLGINGAQLKLDQVINDALTTLVLFDHRADPLRWMVQKLSPRVV